jgi:molybdopterin-binding protein
MLLDTPAGSTFPPTMLTAEITEASAGRMQLSEGKSVYATFKATEARAYT